MCLKKLQIEIPYDLAISLLGIYPNKIKTLIQKNIWKKRYMHPMFTAALFTIMEIGKQPK